MLSRIKKENFLMAKKFPLHKEMRNVLRKYKKQIEGDAEIAKELQDGNKSDSRAKKLKLTRLLELVGTSITFTLAIIKIYTIMVKGL